MYRPLNNTTMEPTVVSFIYLFTFIYLFIFSGQSLSNQRWMLSMEGQVVCEGAQPNFVSGLAALFASFYNFNLQYQEEAACSLEFVQRLDICTFAIHIL